MNDDVAHRRVWLRREVIPRLERDARRDLVDVLARQADAAPRRRRVPRRTRCGAHRTRRFSRAPVASQVRRPHWPAARSGSGSARRRRRSRTSTACSPLLVATSRAVELPGADASSGPADGCTSSSIRSHRSRPPPQRSTCPGRVGVRTRRRRRLGRARAARRMARRPDRRSARRRSGRRDRHASRRRHPARSSVRSGGPAPNAWSTRLREAGVARRGARRDRRSSSRLRGRSAGSSVTVSTTASR